MQANGFLVFLFNWCGAIQALIADFYKEYAVKQQRIDG